MKNTLRSIAAAALLFSGASLALAASHGGNKMVGGAEMFPDKNIVENAVNSADHTTLVAAVKAAGLVDTLMGEGPFTVFAPTNAAFSALPDGTVDTLLKPENKDQLTMRKEATERRVHQPAQRREARRRLPLRGLRPAAVLVGSEIRQRHRLAELLRGVAGCRRLQDRFQADLSAQGRALPPLRRPSGPRLQ
jgi:hypothetical protein